MELERSAASLKPSPEIAIPDRLLVKVCPTSRSYYPAEPPIPIILHVTSLLRGGVVRACPSAFGAAAVQVSHLRPWRFDHESNCFGDAGCDCPVRMHHEHTTGIQCR